MLHSFKKLIRTHQTRLPAILEAKFTAQRFYRRAMRRSHEPDFNAIALFPDSTTGVFIDIGANRGQSIESIRLFNKSADIHAIEANPILASRLENRYANDPSVKIHRLALGKTSGELNLFVPRYRKFVLDGLASSNKDAVISWMRNNMVGFDESKVSFLKYTCKCVRLDDLLLEPYFIKIDVQGDELDVLLGGEKTLAYHKPVLLIEGGEPEMFSYLSEFGYSGYSFSGGRLVPGVRPGCNAFHLTAEHLAVLSD